MWINVKPKHWQRYQEFWFVFLVLNLFTIPLSPMGCGAMSRAAYMPIMWIKVAIVALLLLTGLYMQISSKLYRNHVI